MWVDAVVACVRAHNCVFAASSFLIPSCALVSLHLVQSGVFCCVPVVVLRCCAMSRKTTIFSDVYKAGFDSSHGIKCIHCEVDGDAFVAKTWSQLASHFLQIHGVGMKQLGPHVSLQVAIERDPSKFEITDLEYEHVAAVPGDVTRFVCIKCKQNHKKHNFSKEAAYGHFASFHFKGPEQCDNLEASKKWLVVFDAGVCRRKTFERCRLEPALEIRNRTGELSGQEARVSDAQVVALDAGQLPHQPGQDQVAVVAFDADVGAGGEVLRRVAHALVDMSSGGVAPTLSSSDCLYAADFLFAKADEDKRQGVSPAPSPLSVLRPKASGLQTGGVPSWHSQSGVAVAIAPPTQQGTQVVHTDVAEAGPAVAAQPVSSGQLAQSTPDSAMLGVQSMLGELANLCRNMAQQHANPASSGAAASEVADLPAVSLVPFVVNCGPITPTPPKHPGGTPIHSFPDDFPVIDYDLSEWDEWMRSTDLKPRTIVEYIRSMKRLFSSFSFSKECGDLEKIIAIYRTDSLAKLFDTHLWEPGHSWTISLGNALAKYMEWQGLRCSKDRLRDYKEDLETLAGSVCKTAAKKGRLARKLKKDEKKRRDAQAIAQIPKPDAIRLAVLKSMVALHVLVEDYKAERISLATARITGTMLMIGILFWNGFAGRPGEWQKCQRDYAVAQAKSESNLIVCSEHKTDYLYGELAKFVYNGTKASSATTAAIATSTIAISLRYSL